MCGVHYFNAPYLTANSLSVATVRSGVGPAGTTAGRDGRRTPHRRGTLASAIVSRSLSMPAELIVRDHRISEYSPISSPQGAGGTPAPVHALIQPARREECYLPNTLAAASAAWASSTIGFSSISIRSPKLYMLGEGGHRSFPGRASPKPSRARDTQQPVHSLGRRTAGFEELLKRRLVEAGRVRHVSINFRVTLSYFI